MYTTGSGKRGVLFYPQFLRMICDLFHTPAPRDGAGFGAHDPKQKWANSLWMEIDVQKSGSVNFEAFLNWYLKHFDPESGQRRTDAGRTVSF